MVLEQPGDPAGPQKPSVRVTALGEQELGALGGGRQVWLVSEDGAGFRQRRDHQRVPGRQLLVVGPGPDALGAHAVELALDLRQSLGLGAAPLEYQAVLELARLEVRDRVVVQVTERVAQLGLRPDVELALHALGVGVERGIEPPVGRAHLTQRPVERLAANAAQPRLARHLPAVQVRAREQRVVVEHLLEVRDGPGRVDRVAGEAAPDLVVDPAAGHRAQRRQRCLALAPHQQELDRRGHRELRRAAKAAVARIDRSEQAADRAGEQLVGDRRVARPDPRAGADRGQDLRA